MPGQPSGEPQPAASPKPLWALMGRAPPGAPPQSVPPDEGTPAPEHAATSPATAESAIAGGPSAESAPATAPPAARRKGLWGLMHSTPPAAPPPPATPPLVHFESEIETPESEVPGLSSPVPNPPGAAESPIPIPSDNTFASLIGIESDQPIVPAARPSSETGDKPLFKARLSLVLGGLSIPLSFLALIDAVWSRLPATAVGFAAVLVGMLVVTQSQRSAGREKLRKFAVAGMIAGVVGMFLGPLVLAGLGRRISQSSNRNLTEGHLRTIGVALNRFHDLNGAFPPGGTFKKTKDGRQKGYHGWMTLLLPHLGEENLYKQIHLDLPFDDPTNRPVFEQDLFVFFAAGSDRARVRGRFGASHFAGVGGEVVDDEGNVTQAGLFGINSKISRDNVTDGLSNTLAVGEIADDFPPWGEPENWRTIGPGLNRSTDGFGNHARSGASFLMADGSVRFLSNKTDPRVLTALSTRDGGEK